ncbi:hypothetical protein DY000_02001459 [Brassica cretica]|uniref:Uncharacterized protein n=1 Tax=Brassica cretica TaxID=69181 RepID=A0ABQ7BU90_BRACR|nr:hypothetical protein DY000_02001459 [Brassica cretica]
MPADLQSTAVSEALPIEIPDGGEVEISGSPTEKAILSWAYKLGMKFDTIRSESAIIHAFPFNSGKKRGDLLSMPWRKIACGVWLFACRTQELNKVPKEQEDLDKWSLLEDELTLLAIVGIKIPPRPPRLSYGSKNGIGRGRREAPLKCHRTPTTLSVSSDAEGGVGGSRPDCPEWLHLMRSRKVGRERGAHGKQLFFSFSLSVECCNEFSVQI